MRKSLRLLPLIFICFASFINAQQLVISEFRTSGPGGSSDEFIEIYNPGVSDHLVTAVSGTGYGVATSDGITRASIPNGTLIRSKQHYLVVSSAYSLANYGGTGAAAGNTSYATDIPDNMGIAIFNNNTGGASYTLANRLDAVGSSTEANSLYKEGSGYTALSALNLESALRRKSYNAVPRDSDDNLSDFEFVDNLGTTNGSQQRLGAPGPENLNSPVSRNAAVVLTRLDQTAAALAQPNTFRDLATTGSINPLGTIEFRYRLTNNTGVPLTRIRLRLDSLTTLPAGVTKADLRAMTSSNITINAVNDPATCASTGSPATSPCSVPVMGTTLETPPAQPPGGGFNSTLTLSTIFSGSPLAAGASINIRLLFGVVKTGDYSISFTPEVLPYTAAIGPVPPPEKINGATGPTACTINQASGQADPTSNSPINFTVFFNGAVTGFTSTDVTLSGTAGATTAVVTEIAPNDGTTYNVAVSGMTTSGTVIASIPVGVVLNSSNFGNLASSSTDNTVTYSPASTGPPSVTINQAAGQTDPTGASPINFTAVFSESVTGFTDADITLSGTAGATTAVVTEIAPNNGTTYNIAVSGMTTSGTVIAGIPAGSAVSSANIGNAASASTDNTVTFTVAGPDITVVKTANSATASVGEQVGYTIIVTNTGGGSASDVTLSDALPAGLNWSISSQTATAFSITGPVNSQVLSGNIGTLAPGASTTVTITATATNAGTIINTATVSSSNEAADALANNTSTATITIAAPDITVLKTANSTTANAGQEVGYTITVTNTGGGSASDVTLSDILPAGLNWSISSQTATAFSITGPVNSQVLTGNIGTLAPGASTTVTITATATNAGTIINTATVSSSNEAADASSNNTSTATITIAAPAPDVTVLKTANSATASVGEQVGYTITVTNTGGGSASDVTLTDALPAGLNWSISSQTATAFSITGPVNSQVLTGNIGTLAPGASTSVTITATAISAGTIINTATVSSSNEAADASSNNTSTATFTIAAPDVTVLKTANSSTASVGEQVGYTIIVTNTGGGNASNVGLTDVLPAGLNWSISSQTATAFSITGPVNSQVLTGNIGTLAPGASTTVTITANATNAGTIINTATVSSSNEAADASSNNTSTATITIVSLVPPTITCPANVTTSASVEDCLGTVDLGTLNYIIAGDPAPILSLSWRAGNDPLAALTSIIVVPGTSTLRSFPNGVTTITATAANGTLPNASCQFTVTVADQVPPVITGVSANPAMLAPPNHKMKDVTIDYTVNDCSSVTNVLTVTDNEGNDISDYQVMDAHHVKLRAERNGTGDGRIYTVTITSTDGAGNSSVATIPVIVAHNVSSPRSGAAFRVGSTVNFAGTFWDIAGNKHTATWLIDDKTSIKGTVTEPSAMKNGTAAGSYKFTTPGVYKLQMNVTDQKGVTTYANTNGELEAIVVIYDPNGGYTYGGGWFSSPAGALKSDLNTTGNVSYGFTVNYYKGATLPRGETQFDFKLGEFEFNAVNFDYLSISGAKAQFKGSGKIIGGQSGINFIMTVVDGNLDGTGIDKVRIKIYNKKSGKIYYDNQSGAGDTENPVTAVGSNSEVVVQNANATANLAARMNIDNEELTADAGTLEVTAMPNPGRNSFYLTIRSNYLKDKITMQVTDMYGRIIEVRNILAGQTIQLGDRYRPGTYIVKLIQRNMHRQLKLVKLTE